MHFQPSPGAGFRGRCCNWAIPLAVLKPVDDNGLAEVDSCNWAIPLAVLKLLQLLGRVRVNNQLQLDYTVYGMVR